MAGERKTRKETGKNEVNSYTPAGGVLPIEYKLTAGWLHYHISQLGIFN